MSFAIQPLQKICCTFTAACVWGLGFILVADLVSELQMVRLFHYRWIKLLGSLCGIYYEGVNRCSGHDGLMQYDTIF
jgi:hypothetical protein